MGPDWYLDCWWACSSDTLVYPSIFAFPLLSLHHWSTTMHPCWHNHTCLHSLMHNTCLHFIGPASLIWWTDVLQFTCFISILSSPTCTLPWPDQSWILAPCGQALTIALLQMSLVLAFLFTICILTWVWCWSTFHNIFKNLGYLLHDQWTCLSKSTKHCKGFVAYCKYKW